MMNRIGGWLAGLALAVLVGSVALAAPATPAVPGGGNTHNDNPNAATPAVPGLHANEPAVGDMDDRDAGDMVEQHSDLRDAAKAKWEAMTPAQREQFLKDHPRINRRILQRTWDKMTPGERAQFVRNHPELRERLEERWRSLTPEQRRAFLDKHPRIAKRAARRIHNKEGRQGEREGRPAAGTRREPGDQGVRDRGAGQGRDGAGQGGEKRSPQGGPKK